MLTTRENTDLSGTHFCKEGAAEHRMPAAEDARTRAICFACCHRILELDAAFFSGYLFRTIELYSKGC
jgi:hypothetical protein